jgi:exosortase
MTAAESDSHTPRPGRISDRILADAPDQSFAFDLWAVIKIAVIMGLIWWVNRVQFPGMWHEWGNDDNWSHGYLIPLFSLFLIYVRFRELLAVERKVCWWGLPFVVVFCVLQWQAYSFQNPWSCQVSMAFLTASLVLFVAGWGMFKLLWLPILFLIFAMPIPDPLYDPMAVKLQGIATTGGAAVLRLFGVKLAVTGSSLFVTNVHGEEVQLGVKEACAGVRLLMAFVALSVAMAYMTARPVWQRIVLVLMGVPVAIASNVLRVAGTCAFFVWGYDELGEDVMHSFAGILTLIPAAGMLWLLAKLMDALFVEVDDEDEDEVPVGSEGESVS